MRLLISLIILFAVAIGLAVGARFNPGNVVFFYPPYRIDLSLNFFILLAVLLFLALTFVRSAIRATRQIPARVVAYRREKREREGNAALRESVKTLFEGRFGHSEKAAERAAKIPENSGLAALIAARAAQSLGHPERRDTWLEKAKADESLLMATQVSAIELSIHERNVERALEAINALSESGTRHIHVLRLALKANQRAGKWEEVLRLVRLLDKRSALHPALSRRLRELAYDDLLKNKVHDAARLRRFWDEVPAADRVLLPVALRGAAAFSEIGLNDDARRILEKALAQEWDSELIRAYADCAASEGSAGLVNQIERCEAWLKEHPGDAELSLTLGILCLRQKLWGKAQQHLEDALGAASESRTVRRAHLKLAQLHETLGQDGDAATHFRQSALTDLY